MILKNTYLFVLRYGFLLVLLSVCNIFSPDFSAKTMLTDLNLESMVDSQSGTNSIKQIFWAVLFLFFVSQYVLFRFRNKHYKRFNKKLLLLIIIGLVCIFSGLWSEYLFQSFKRSIFQILFISVICISAFYSVAYETFERSVKIATVLVLSFTIVSIALGIGFNAKGALAGYFQNKNTLAITVLSLLALNYLIVMQNLSKSNKIDRQSWVLIFGLICCLLVSASKTNIFIFLLLPIFHSLNLRILRLTAVSIFLGLSFLFILMPISYLFTEHYIVLSDFVDDTFITGRGLIWKTIYYDLITFEKLTLGYGYGSYFGVPSIPYYFDDSLSFLRFINSAHNGYLELLIQFGIIFSCFIIFILGALIYSLQKKEYLVVAMIPILQNITESSFLRDNLIYWFLFILIVIYKTLPHRFVGKRLVNHIFPS